MWTDANLSEAVKASKSVRDTCRYLGVPIIGGSYRKISAKIKELGLSTDHFNPFARPDRVDPKKIPLDDLLVKGDGKYASSRLRRRLIEEGRLKNKCVECGQGPEWFGEELTIQLDHINGDPTDNRIENLRLLCPNCHSQTKTFCGRNVKRNKRMGGRVV